MAVANEAKGLAEAQRRIAACRKTRSESLDLSGLGLTRVPEGLMNSTGSGSLTSRTSDARAHSAV